MTTETTDLRRSRTIGVIGAVHAVALGIIAIPTIMAGTRRVTEVGWIRAGLRRESM